MRVLIIEDDRELALAMSEYLELNQVQCDFAYNGASGIELAKSQPFDCLILDNMLPKVQGVEVCKRLREDGLNTPILMLTACDTQSDQLAGFEAGLDDFVTKPCSMPILLARLQALYRRNNPEQDVLRIADLCIFPKERRVTRSKQTIKLPPISWKILLQLARKYPAVVSKTELIDTIWPDEEADEATLNVHIHQVRKLIDKPFSKALIKTHVGVGLSLYAEGDLDSKA